LLWVVTYGCFFGYWFCGTIAAVTSLATASMGAIGPVSILESSLPVSTGKQEGQADNSDDADDFHFFLLLHNA